MSAHVRHVRRRELLPCLDLRCVRPNTIHCVFAGFVILFATDVGLADGVLVLLGMRDIELNTDESGDKFSESGLNRAVAARAETLQEKSLRLAKLDKLFGCP